MVCNNLKVYSMVKHNINREILLLFGNFESDQNKYDTKKVFQKNFYSTGFCYKGQDSKWRGTLKFLKNIQNFNLTGHLCQ